MRVPNEKGELAVLVCPDCNHHEVLDPYWLVEVGNTMLAACDEGCGDEKIKHHQIVKFVRADEAIE